MPLSFSPSASFIIRLRRNAPRLLRRLPRPRWAIRRCTGSTSATMATAALTSSSLRHTARRGRQTRKPQADFRDCLSLHKLCDTPLCCLLQAPCAPSPSFTSASRNIVITAHRHIQPLDLICVSASRESGAVVCVPIRERNFHAHGSDFTAQWWGRLCIFRGGARGERKNDVQRGGGCAKPLRGQAPVTPKRLLHSRFASATHYKLEDFVAGTLADAPNLPVSQIFTLDFHGTRRA